MKNQQISIEFQEFASIEELNAEDRELAQAAIEGMRGSYAPYSHFNVGAAVRLSNGQIVRGANQENAAFPSGLCAERTLPPGYGTVSGQVGKAYVGYYGRR